MLVSSPVRVALIHEAVLPVLAYGGTERVVWWLSKALANAGVEVTLVCKPGSHCDWARVVHPDFKRPIESQLPDVDFFHYFNTPGVTPTRPYLVTIEGNGKPGERFLRNTVFVSQNHARRHGAECFVYNGVDPQEYVYADRKEPSLLFLAKAAWRVKNVRGAIRIARRAQRPLQVLGGTRWIGNHWRGIHWRGMLGGKAKAEWISRCSGLLFPVLWDEPFGIAVIEALVSGTPVFATPWGSLPELVHPDVGQICTSENDFLEAIREIDRFRPNRCREWALERFSCVQMAASYQTLYERVLAGQWLNADCPRTVEASADRFPTRLPVVGENSGVLPA